ncbi:MAG TPA: class II fructose-bisphosphate aldolase [Microlunatus sp.]|nr:class II fructose-bisphosphate aldolase [Microlunatus sp.]
MPLTTAQQLLDDAVARRGAVSAFNVITLESAEGIVTGAERAGVPVIMQLSENAAKFHRGNPRPIAAGMAALAAATDVPVALHLDHVEDRDLLYASVGAGFSSVMFDAGRLPYDENVDLTRQAARWAHDQGLSIEAELGFVGGKTTQVQSAHAAGVRTDPRQAAEFVAETGVDALAVAVGSAHAMTVRTATLDLALITRIADAVPVPLVLHGSSGVPDAELTAAVAAGMRKINVGTILNVAYTAGVRSVLDDQPDVTDPRTYLRPARDRVADQVHALLRVLH